MSPSVVQARSQEPLTDEPFHQWVGACDTPWVNFHRVGRDYLIRFPAFADFVISSNGLDIFCYPIPGTHDEELKRCYRNQVFPLALSLRNKLVLHGSAVEIGTEAIVFLGLSGSGKSTLAASFAAAGARFLSDDSLQIKRIGPRQLVCPGHPSITLWKDSLEALIPDKLAPSVTASITRKSSIRAGEYITHCDEPKLLSHLFLLGEQRVDSTSIRRVSGGIAVKELIRHSLLLNIQDSEALSRHFGQLSSVIRNSKIYYLDYPRRFDLLPQIRDSISAHLG